MRAIIISAFIFLSYLTGCKKHTIANAPPAEEPLSTGVVRGLPERYDSVHGYFFVGYKTTFFDTLQPPMTFRLMYACFMEPAADLVAGFNPYLPGSSTNLKGGNIAPGAVLGNNDSLYRVEFQFESSYRRMNDTVKPHNDLPFTFNWYVSGNKSYIESRHTFSNPFIKVPDSVFTFHFQSGIEKTLYLDSLAGDRDSCYIAFSKPYSALFIHGFDNLNVLGRTGNEEKVLILRAQQTQWLKSAYDRNEMTHLSVGAFKYFHQWVNGRLYIFQFSTEWRVPVKPG